MGDNVANREICSGFVIRNGDKFDLCSIYNCRKLEGIDYFLTAFQDESDFRSFLKTVVSDSKIDIDHADIYIFSPGRNGDLRFDDMIFSDDSTYRKFVDLINAGADINFYSYLNSRYQDYKEDNRYKALFDSEINNSYSELKKCMDLSDEAGRDKLSLRKPDWLKKRYNNYRSVFNISEIYSKELKELNDHDFIEKIGEKFRVLHKRDYLKDAITKKLNSIEEINRQVGTNRELDIFMFGSEDLAEYNRSKNGLDVSVLENVKLRHLSPNEVKRRKDEIKKILFNEGYLPLDSFQKNGNDWCLDMSMLLPDHSDEARNFLGSVPTPKLLKYLFNVKQDYEDYYGFRNNDYYSESNAKMAIMESNDGSLTTFNKYLDKLTDEKNYSYFLRLYEFSLLLQNARKDKYIEPESIDGEYDPDKVAASRNACLEKMKALKEGSKGGRTK